MVPPGTSTVLRSRRRDASLKPNRTLDRTSSRGMLYENEELRLRTININAEVEKGQYYIKKLRRENQQLKREIWNLREEYERLENYVKSREQSENEEEEDEDKLITDEEQQQEIGKLESGLSTVIEENDMQDQLQIIEEEKDNTFDTSELQLYPETCAQGDEDDIINNNNNNDIRHANNATVVVEEMAVAPEQTDNGMAQPLTADVPTPAVCGDGDVNECRGGAAAAANGSPPSPPPPPLFLCCNTPSPPHPRPADADETHERQRQLLGLHPDAVATPAAAATAGSVHTACFDFGQQKQLQNLTVDEVIEATDPELRDKLRGVRLVDDRCYMTFGSAHCMEKALHTTLQIREVPVLLMDTGAGATMLSLTGVPDSVADKEVLKNLKKYGTIIGGVERKTCRGMPGSERYVRVRLTLGSPRYLWFGSHKAIVRQLTEHETGTMNSIARRKSFKSQIKLNLKMADPSTLSGSPLPDEQGKENGTTMVTAATQATPSVQQGSAFRFPSDPKINTTAAAAEPRTVSRASIKSMTGTAKKPAGQESPIRGRRRPSLMGFRRDTIKHRGGSLSRGDGDDAESDTSTICRRKLSMTGRENTEKVPWCGCWGNGCL